MVAALQGSLLERFAQRQPTHLQMPHMLTGAPHNINRSPPTCKCSSCSYSSASSWGARAAASSWDSCRHRRRVDGTRLGIHTRRERSGLHVNDIEDVRLGKRHPQVDCRGRGQQQAGAQRHISTHSLTYCSFGVLSYKCFLPPTALHPTRHFRLHPTVAPCPRPPAAPWSSWRHPVLPGQRAEPPCRGRGFGARL